MFGELPLSVVCASMLSMISPPTVTIRGDLQENEVVAISRAKFIFLSEVKAKQLDERR